MSPTKRLNDSFSTNCQRLIVGHILRGPLHRDRLLPSRSEIAIYAINQPALSQRALFRANSDSQAHNVRMSEKRTKADKAQREGDLLDKKSSHRPPQNQGKKPREDFNQAAVRKVEEAAEKH